MTDLGLRSQERLAQWCITFPPGATLSTMPTTRHRYTITETDEVELALREAARRWPAESGAPSRLLLHLVAEGHKALRRERDDAAAARRAAVERTSGLLTDVYPQDYLERLREDWPE